VIWHDVLNSETENDEGLVVIAVAFEVVGLSQRVLAFGVWLAV